MRSVSAGFLAAVRNSGQRVDRAYVISGGASVEVPLVDYKVTAARDAVARYSGSVSLAPGVDPDTLAPYGARIQIRSGFVVAGGEETVPVGTMRIDSVAVDEAGGVEMQAFGLEKAVEDARFVTPQVIQDTSALSAIVELLSVVDAEVSIRTTSDAAVPRTVYDRERWKAIDGDDASLARAIGVEVYCDAAGAFVIRDVPTLNDAPVWTVDAGAGGVLTGFRRTLSRDGVYNVVVAVGDRLGAGGTSDMDTGEVALAVAQDEDPGSPTNVTGEFGQVVRFYSSPVLVPGDPAFRAARSMLANSLGLARSLDLTAVPNPALEPGDVVTVTLPDGTSEAHLLDSLTFAGSGEQSAQTRMTRGL